MVVILIVGLVLLAAPELNCPEPYSSFAVHLGTALIIASILGLTIDFWLKIYQLAIWRWYVCVCFYGRIEPCNKHKSGGRTS